MTADTIGPPHKAARNRKAGGTGQEKKPSDHAGLCTSSCGAKVRGTQVREEPFRFRHTGGNEMMGLCQHIIQYHDVFKCPPGSLLQEKDGL